jgi:hypothetical protein
MRALHLIGMRAAGGGKLRFRPSDDAPLVLPSWFSESDREIILAFYQQVLGEYPLPRIEVDWYRSLVEADRSFLRNTHERHGSGEYLVVVKVRHEGADLREILTQPELRPFQHVAVLAGNELAGETLGRLGELTRFVMLTVEELYDEMAGELMLRSDGNALVEPLVRTLLNPILVVEAYNALVDVHAEGVPPDEQGKAVLRRILGRLLDDMPSQIAVALSALALGGIDAFTSAFIEPQRTDALTALRARMLLRDGRLVRWAQLLEDKGMHDIVGERLGDIVRPRGRPPNGAKKVLGMFNDGRRQKSDPIHARVSAAFRLLNKGEIGRARDELTALERELDSSEITDVTRGDFWGVVGRLRKAEGRWADAESAFRRSLDLLQRGGASPSSRAIMMFTFARGLQDNGQQQEGDSLTREGLRIMAEETRDQPPAK